jgi:tetratricopeptide (TPR) repeat protein
MKIKFLAIPVLLLISVVFCDAQKRNKKEQPVKKEAEFIFLFDEANKNRLLENYETAIDQYLKAIEVNPNSAASCFYLASIYISQKEYEPAFKYANKAVELQPDNFWYRVELADIHYITGHTKESVKIFQDFYTRYPDNDFVFNRLVKQLNEQKDNGNLIKLFEAKEKRNGLSEEEYSDLYQLYKTVNAFDKAENVLNSLIQKYTHQSRYGILLAEHFILLGNKTKANEQFNVLLKQFPDDTNVILSYAWFTRSIGLKEEYYQTVKTLLATDLDINTKVNLLISGQYPNFQGDRYLELLELLYSKHSDQLIANTLFAEYYIEKEKKEKAVIYIKKALIAEQNNFNLVLVLFELLYDTENFNELYNESVHYSFLYPTHSKLYLYQGLALYKTKQYESAIKALENGIEFVYDDWTLLNQFYYYLAESFHELSEHEKSDELFEKIIATSDNFYLAFNHYAFYLAERELNLKKAELLAKKCIDNDEENPVFANTYAFCLYKNGNYSEALVFSEKAISILSKNTEYLDLHGDILFFLDRKEEALNYWNLSKQNGNQNKNLLFKIENISKLKKEDIK